MSEELVVEVKEEGGTDAFNEVTVVATTRPQMEAAQRTLVACAASRLERLEVELLDLEKNLALAKANKLRQAPIQAAIYKAKRRITFYTKLRYAFEMGYTLIPNMAVDVFAVKTNRQGPKKEHLTDSHTSSWVSSPWLKLVFPFILAKVFDEIGVLPASSNGDPMVIGRIILKEPGNTRRMNFLIAWFVDTKTL